MYSRPESFYLLASIIQNSTRNPLDVEDNVKLLQRYESALEKASEEKAAEYQKKYREQEALENVEKIKSLQKEVSRVTQLYYDERQKNVQKRCCKRGGGGA